ncbi:MAG: hypothetical protein RI885_1039, partial [Actinomycetota bacterium]
MTVRVAVVGASGRLGAVVSRLVREADDLELVAELDSRSPLDDMLEAEVVVDVTVPAVSGTVVDFAVGHGLNVLVGTSGWSGERIASLTTKLASLPEQGVVIIPNFSIGSVLATRFAAMAARFFDSIEIVETHHLSKVDSPSGTAVRTAELIGAARAELGPVVAPHTDQRSRGQQVSSIPIHSLRMQGVAARQDVVFGGSGELLTLSHETLSSSSYEVGVLLAV